MSEPPSEDTGKSQPAEPPKPEDLVEKNDDRGLRSNNTASDTSDRA